MAFLKLPRLGTVDPSDKREFGRYWDALCTEIEDSFNRILTLEDGALTLGLRIDDVSAGSLFRVVPGTTIVGTEATVELQVRAGLMESFRQAVIRLSALAGVASRIDINADGVYVNGILLSSGGILTGMLATNAATFPNSMAWTAPVAMAAASAWTLLATLTATFLGGVKVGVEVASQFKNTDAGNHLFGVVVTFDSTDPTTGTPATTRPYNSGSATMGIGGSGVQFPFATAFQIAAAVVSAGSHTLRVYANSDSTAVSSEQGEIKFTEYRR